MVLLAIAPLLLQPTQISLSVDGTNRTAWVIPPARPSAGPVPTVFFFHGLGGNGRISMNTVRIQNQWPEALVVYPNGLPLEAANRRIGGRPGWVLSGDTNRDVQFFDALLEKVQKEYQADPRRLFVGGHSNGGMFTYYLWGRRADKITAVAPCAATGGRNVQEAKPAFIVMGETDTVVDSARQKESIDTVKKINGAVEPGTKNGYLTAYSGRKPTTTYIFPGGHQFPRECVGPMVSFWKALL